MKTEVTPEQIDMIKEVRAELSMRELKMYVCEFTGEFSAPEHDKYIVSAALLGYRRAMLLCGMLK